MLKSNLETNDKKKQKRNLKIKQLLTVQNLSLCVHMIVHNTAWNSFDNVL